MNAQRALLDELMGTARNLTDEQKKEHKEVKWDDRDVCGPFMVRFCPHDLFVNTRTKLGPCSRIHDPKLKESFEKSPRHDSYKRRFEAELAQQCEKLVLDLDRIIRRGRDRLAQDAAILLPNSVRKPEKLSGLEENINKMLVQVEELGEAGKVDEAEALMKQVDVLNAEKTTLTKQIDIKMAMLEKKKELCETCGSFMVSDEALVRTQSHLTGKQHIGYGMVRDFLTEYKKKAREKKKLAREKKADERRNYREKEYHSGGRGSDTRREKSGRRDYDRDHHYVRNCGRERSYDQRERGSEYRSSSYRNGRDSDRGGCRYMSGKMTNDSGRVRSRSRYPNMHGLNNNECKI